MNILMYVMTVLMMLSILAYARLDTYFSFSATQAEFDRYMQQIERSTFNAIEEDWYKTTVGSKKDSKTQSEKVPGTSRLSWFPLLKKEQKKKENATRLLSKALMNQLFNNEAFFKEAIEKNYNVLDDLIDQILQAADQYELEHDKITRINQLSNLKLADPTLNVLFYKMLKGYLPDKEFADGTKQLDSDDETEEEEENSAKAEKMESHANKRGSISLAEHLTLSSDSVIRVYLAPRSLLLAIYGDENIVNAIQAERLAHYKHVKNASDEERNTAKQEATRRFEEQFKNQTPAPYKDLVNFNVTVVDPKKYEKEVK